MMGSNLTQKDLDALGRSYITPDLAGCAGLRRLNSGEGAELIGRTDKGDYSGVAFPYLWPGETQPREYRLRRDHPDIELEAGKSHEKAKYMSPPGRGNLLYFPPDVSTDMLTDASIPIVILEGEKKTLAAWRLSTEGTDRPRFLPVGLAGVSGWRGKRGIQAGSDGGRRQVKGPIADLDRITWKDRRVIIAFDSDVKHNPRVGEARRELGKELGEQRQADVYVIDLPDLEGLPKTGVDDYLAHEGPDAMLRLLDGAQRVKRETVEEIVARVGITRLQAGCLLDEVVTRLRLLIPELKGLDGLTRAALRELVIVHLKSIKVLAPAQLVDPVFSAHAEEGGDATGFDFKEDPAWEDEVDAAELLDDFRRIYKRYVSLPEGGADASALWDLHTYVLDAIDISPFFAISSPEKRCGKTVMLEVKTSLVNRPLPASNISPAATYRVVDKFHPVLLVDECDTFFDQNEELRGIYNSGHRKSFAFTVRCVGDDSEPTRFSTWCPKALARIGDFSDTISDRSIIVRLSRKTSDEKVERFHLEQALIDFEYLRRKAAKWAKDHLADLRAAHPEIPDTLNDRQGDNWTPLFAIADLAGGHWPKTARKAALLLSGEADQDQSVRVQLLIDIKKTFQDRDDPMQEMESIVLVSRLTDLEDRPWGEWKKEKPMTAIQLARELRHFKIRPKQFRSGDKKRGYFPEDFKEVFARYIPPAGPPEGTDPVHPVQPNGMNGLEDEIEPVQTRYKSVHPVQTASRTGSESVRTDSCTGSKVAASDCKQTVVPTVPTQTPEKAGPEGDTPEYMERVKEFFKHHPPARQAEPEPTKAN